MRALAAAAGGAEHLHSHADFNEAHRKVYSCVSSTCENTWEGGGELMAKTLMRAQK